jgi:hypothetical protein
VYCVRTTRYCVDHSLMLQLDGKIGWEWKEGLTDKTVPTGVRSTSSLYSVCFVDSQLGSMQQVIGSCLREPEVDIFATGASAHKHRRQGVLEPSC